MKVAFITGASSGFGMYTTLALARKGYKVFATMRNAQNRSQLEELAYQEQIAKNIHVLQLDVTKPETIQQAVEDVKERVAHVDVLINNAGYCQGGFFAQLNDKEWLDQYETNLFGVVRVTRALLPFLVREGKGKIINVSSVSGYFGFPGMSPYTSSKFALEGLSESLRLELRHEGVWVSIVQPASYRTKIWDQGLAKVAVQQERSAFQEKMLQEAVASKENGSDPQDVAALIAQICDKKKPRFRYPIGKGARALARVKRWLPWSLIEGAVYHHLKAK